MQSSPQTEHGLRIAILAPGEIFGGAERQILALATTLKAATEASVILAVFHNGELAERARTLGVPVRVLGDRLVDLGSIRQLRTMMHEERIDVVSLHGYRATVYFALATPAMSIGAVKTEHGRPETAEDRFLERLRSHLYRWLECASTRWLGAHVAYVTEELQNRCSEEHRHLERSVIYNGIETLDRTSLIRPPEFLPERVNLVVVARLDRVKGIDVAISAMANPAMPLSAHLFLIGSGPEQQHLHELARRLGVAARVSFLGFRSNVFELMAHADALLMPSRHEGLPYALLEALSLKTPVIASKVGGLAEVLHHQETAILVTPDDPTALAQSVRWLIETPGAKDQLTENGLSLVSAQFTVGKMATQYEALFNSVRSSQIGRRPT